MLGFGAHLFWGSSSFLNKIFINFIVLLFPLLLKVFIVFLLFLLHEQNLVLGEVHR
jgi:hypothetical protein